MRKIKFTQLPDGDMPQDIEEHLTRSEEIEGARLLKSSSGEFVQVMVGERPTGGYSVEIKDMVEDRGILTISVKEKKPKAGDIVTQAFTYPKCFVKLEEKVDCGEIRINKV